MPRCRSPIARITPFQTEARKTPHLEARNPDVCTLMPTIFTSHLCVTWALVGLIWTVQLVLYPLFAGVGAGTFKAYHQRHCTQITWVVAPLMFIELVTAAWLVVDGSRDVGLLISLAPLAFNWLSTWRVQIPLHNTLSSGFNAQAHQRLVTTNWWRTIAWTLRGCSLLFVSN